MGHRRNTNRMERRVPYKDSKERPTRMQELQRNYADISAWKIFLNRIIMERLKNEVDNILRDHQALFRQGRGCIDQIATLRIIVEQSLEFDSSLYINFVDYEKAFDSLDRDTLWKLLQHYGIREKIITLIRNTYDGMTCKVTHAARLIESFQLKTGVKALPHVTISSTISLTMLALTLSLQR